MRVSYGDAVGIDHLTIGHSHLLYARRGKYINLHHWCRDASNTYKQTNKQTHTRPNFVVIFEIEINWWPQIQQHQQRHDTKKQRQHRKSLQTLALWFQIAFYACRPSTKWSLVLSIQRHRIWEDQRPEHGEEWNPGIIMHTISRYQNTSSAIIGSKPKTVYANSNELSKSRQNNSPNTIN